jgi:hypothetical protein
MIIDCKKIDLHIDAGELSNVICSAYVIGS